MNRVDFRRTFWFLVGPNESWEIMEPFAGSSPGGLGCDSSGRRPLRTPTPLLVACTVLHGTVVRPVPYRLRPTSRSPAQREVRTFILTVLPDTPRAHGA